MLSSTNKNNINATSQNNKHANSKHNIEEDRNKYCIIAIEEDNIGNSTMYSKIMNVVLTIICIGLLLIVVMVLNPPVKSQQILAFSNETTEATEGIVKTMWKAVKPIISPDTAAAASEISVANVTRFRINHHNNHSLNNNTIINNYNYYNCNHTDK
ncbi:hypothetical protein ACI65C_009464 [Semiaphis heraclei]